MSKLFRDWNISEHPPWLKKDGKNRLFSLNLINVTDPLNADAIWDHTTGGDKEITNEYGEFTNRRLLEALKAHYYTTTAYRNQAPIIRKFIFSDVIIWISASLWREATIQNGEDLFFMSERFRYQHEQSFSDEQRFKQRPPNFCIMPMQGLPIDQVICQFGMGVFLPNKDDVQTASLGVMKRGHQPEPLPDWVFFEKKDSNDSDQPVAKVTRPAGLYDAQTMLLLSGNYLQASIKSPYWINGHSDGELIINLNSAKPSTYGDEHNITAEPPKRSGKQTNCYFHEPGKTDNGITLIINRISHNKVEEALRQSARPGNTGTVIDDGEDSLSGLTSIDMGDNDLPDYIYQLNLTGIVLPKLDTLKIADKLSHWELSLDKQGLPVSQDESAHWTIRGGHSENRLEWRLAEIEQESPWQPLDPQAPLPYPETEASHLLPAALSDKQFAILPLSSTATTIPIGTEALTLGRYTDKNSPAEFPLHALKHNSALIYKDGSRHGSLDSIGLSAEHIVLKLQGRSAQLQQLKSQSFLLSKKGEIRQVLTVKDKFGTLNPGERLIIGPLCFELFEEFLPDRVD